MAKPWRCHFCGRTKDDHGSIACFGSMGPGVGQNMTGGAKPPRATKKEPPKK